MIRIKKRQAWVWVAYEPRLRVFLAFKVSYNRSILDAYLFLKDLRRRRYGLRPVWTDDADWYPEACRWARLEHHVYGPGRTKNLVERMNEALKDRLENFDDLFPCINGDMCDREHVSNWIRVFRFFHNLRTSGQGKKDDSVPEYQRFIETLCQALT